MENTVNKLLILPFEQGDDSYPCRIGSQITQVKIKRVIQYDKEIRN